MKQKEKQQSKSRYSTPVRVLALVMSLLVTGGVLTALVQMVIDLFA